MTNQQSKQTGSTVIFVVVGVILSIALIAGIAFVRKQFATAGETPGQVAVSSEQSTSSGSSQNSSTNQNDDAAKQAEEAAKKKAEEEAAAKKAEEEKQKREAAAAEAKKQQEQAAAQAAQSAQSQTATTGDLPTTGPLEDLFMMVVGAVAIFGAGYVYYHYGRN